MAATMSFRCATLGAAMLALVGCAGAGPAATDRMWREQVGKNLEDLKQGLQAGTWNRVERFFSPAYAEGYGELRDRLETHFRDQRVIDLQFTVNRVLESDGLVNAQVRWRKTWVNKVGVPGKAEGVSEFILKPHGTGFHILGINGARLF